MYNADDGGDMPTSAEIMSLVKTAEEVHKNAKELSKKLYDLLKTEKTDSDEEDEYDDDGNVVEKKPSQVAKAYKASSEARTSSYATYLLLNSIIRDLSNDTK